MPDAKWRQCVSYTSDMSRRTEFVSVHLAPAARDVLRQAALELSVPIGRRLSMSDVLIKAVRIAMRHRDELIVALASPNEADK